MPTLLPSGTVDRIRSAGLIVVGLAAFISAWVAVPGIALRPAPRS